MDVVMVRCRVRRHNNVSGSIESVTRLARAARSGTIRRRMWRRRTPPLRTAAASRLRAWANRLEPPRRVDRVQPPTAPLVRLGGRWWPREEITGGGATAP
jgi:hypothetical protein